MFLNDLSILGFFTGVRESLGNDLLFIPSNKKRYSNEDIDRFFNYIGDITKSGTVPVFSIIVDNSTRVFVDEHFMLDSIQKYCGTNVNQVYMIEPERIDDNCFTFSVMRVNESGMWKILQDSYSDFSSTTESQILRWIEMRKKIDDFYEKTEGLGKSTVLSEEIGFLEYLGKKIIKQIQFDENNQKIVNIPLDQQIAMEYIQNSIRQTNSPTEDEKISNFSRKLKILIRHVEDIKYDIYDSQNLEIALQHFQDYENITKEMRAELSEIINDGNSGNTVEELVMSLNVTSLLIEENIKQISDYIFLVNLEKLYENKKEFFTKAMPTNLNDLTEKYLGLNEKLFEIEKFKTKLRVIESGAELSKTEDSRVKGRIHECSKQMEDFSSKLRDEKKSIQGTILLNHILQDVVAVVERIESLIELVRDNSSSCDKIETRHHISMIFNTARKTYEYGDTSLLIASSLVEKLKLRQDRIIDPRIKLDDCWTRMMTLMNSLENTSLDDVEGVSESVRITDEESNCVVRQLDSVEIVCSEESEFEEVSELQKTGMLYQNVCSIKNEHSQFPNFEKGCQELEYSFERLKKLMNERVYMLEKSDSFCQETEHLCETIRQSTEFLRESINSDNIDDLIDKTNDDIEKRYKNAVEGGKIMIEQIEALNQFIIRESKQNEATESISKISSALGLLSEGYSQLQQILKQFQQRVRSFKGPNTEQFSNISNDIDDFEDQLECLQSTLIRSKRTCMNAMEKLSEIKVHFNEIQTQVNGLSNQVIHLTDSEIKTNSEKRINELNKRLKKLTLKFEECTECYEKAIIFFEESDKFELEINEVETAVYYIDRFDRPSTELYSQSIIKEKSFKQLTAKLTEMFDAGGLNSSGIQQLLANISLRLEVLGKSHELQHKAANLILDDDYSMLNEWYEYALKRGFGDPISCPHNYQECQIAIDEAINQSIELKLKNPIVVRLKLLLESKMKKESSNYPKNSIEVEYINSVDELVHNWTEIVDMVESRRCLLQNYNNFLKSKNKLVDDSTKLGDIISLFWDNPQLATDRAILNVNAEYTRISRAIYDVCEEGNNIELEMTNQGMDPQNLTNSIEELRDLATKLSEIMGFLTVSQDETLLEEWKNFSEECRNLVYTIKESEMFIMPRHIDDDDPDETISLCRDILTKLDASVRKTRSTVTEYLTKADNMGGLKNDGIDILSENLHTTFTEYENMVNEHASFISQIVDYCTQLKKLQENMGSLKTTSSKKQVEDLKEKIKFQYDELNKVAQIMQKDFRRSPHQEMQVLLDELWNIPDKVTHSFNMVDKILNQLDDTIYQIQEWKKFSAQSFLCNQGIENNFRSIEKLYTETESDALDYIVSYSDSENVKERLRDMQTLMEKCRNFDIILEDYFSISRWVKRVRDEYKESSLFEETEFYEERLEKCQQMALNNCIQQEIDQIDILKNEFYSVVNKNREECNTFKTAKIIKTKQLAESKSPQQDLLPSFKQHLYNVRVLCGNDVALECTPRNSTHFEWFFNDKPITQTQVVDSDFPLCQLLIKQVKVADSGTYVCQITNSHGSANTSFIVDVQKINSTDESDFPGDVLDTTTEQNGFVEQMERRILGNINKMVPHYIICYKKHIENFSPKIYSLRLEKHPNKQSIGCFIYGGDNSNVYIYCSGKYVEKDQIVSINHSEDGFFEVILKPSQRECVYSVVVTNKSGKCVETYKSDQSFIGEKHIKPFFCLVPDNKTVQQNSHEKFTCQCRGLPTPRVDWYLNGNIASRNKYVKTTMNDNMSFLIIEKVNKDNSGKYMCFGSNSTGCHHFSLDLTYSENVPIKPFFRQSLKRTELKEKENLYLQVVAGGNPFPTFIWKKDGEVLSEDEKIKIESVGEMSRLIIMEVKVEDSGLYQCYLRNECGGQFCETKVKVNEVYQPKLDKFYKSKNQSSKAGGLSFSEKEEIQQISEPQNVFSVPFFKFLPTNCTITENEGKAFTVHCGGQPAPNVTWAINGKKLDNSRKYEIINDGFISKLIIRSATMENSGTLEITASNECGTITKSVIIQVDPKHDFYRHLRSSKQMSERKRPIFVDQIHSVETETTSKMILECRLEAIDNTEVTWMFNGYDIEEYSGKYQVETKNDGTCRLLVNELSEKDGGIYACYASNRKGSGLIKANIKMSDMSSSLEPKYPPINLKRGDFVEFQLGNPSYNTVLSWRREGMNEKTICPRKNEGSNLFSIMNVDDSSGGIYNLELEDITNKCIIRMSLELTGKGDQEYDFVLKISPKNISEWESDEFTCDVISKPKPNVRWFYNEDELEGFGNFVYFTKNSEHNIGITDKPKHLFQEPIYARDSDNLVKYYSSIDVTANKDKQFPPKFMIAITTSVSDKAKFETRISGKPLPEVTWYKDGEEMNTSQRRFLEYGQDGRVSLVILDISTDDIGKYTCIARNPMGYDITETSLDLPQKKVQKISDEEAKFSPYRQKDIKIKSENRILNKEKSVFTEMKTQEEVRVEPGTLPKLQTIYDVKINLGSFEREGNTEDSYEIHHSDVKPKSTLDVKKDKFVPYTPDSESVEEIEYPFEDESLRERKYTSTSFSSDTPEILKGDDLPMTFKGLVEQKSFEAMKIHKPKGYVGQHPLQPKESANFFENLQESDPDDNKKEKISFSQSVSFEDRPKSSQMSVRTQFIGIKGVDPSNKEEMDSFGEDDIPTPTDLRNIEIKTVELPENPIPLTIETLRSKETQKRDDFPKERIVLKETGVIKQEDFSKLPEFSQKYTTSLEKRDPRKFEEIGRNTEKDVRIVFGDQSSDKTPQEIKKYTTSVGKDPQKPDEKGGWHEKDVRIVFGDQSSGGSLQDIRKYATSSEKGDPRKFEEIGRNTEKDVRILNEDQSSDKTPQEIKKYTTLLERDPRKPEEKGSRYEKDVRIEFVDHTSGGPAHEIKKTTYETSISESTLEPISDDEIPYARQDSSDPTKLPLFPQIRSDSDNNIFIKCQDESLITEDSIQEDQSEYDVINYEIVHKDDSNTTIQTTVTTSTLVGPHETQHDSSFEFCDSRKLSTDEEVNDCDKSKPFMNSIIETSKRPKYYQPLDVKEHVTAPQLSSDSGMAQNISLDSISSNLIKQSSKKAGNKAGYSPLDSVMNFTRRLRNIRIKEKSTAEFVCEYSSGYAKSSWYHQHSLVDLDTGKYCVLNSHRVCRLQIRNVQVGDAGEVECIINGRSTIARLIVEKLVDVFRTKLSNQSVHIGSPARFWVELEADGVGVDWMINNQPLTDNMEGISITENDSFHYLTIENVSKDDHAKIVTAQSLNFSTSAMINVKGCEETLVVIRRMEGFLAYPHENVVFIIEFSRPCHNVSWYHKDKLIVPNLTKYERYCDNGIQHCLIVSNVDKSDSGTYFVYFEDSGCDQADLIVQDPRMIDEFSHIEFD